MSGRASLAVEYQLCRSPHRLRGIQGWADCNTDWSLIGLVPNPVQDINPLCTNPDLKSRGYRLGFDGKYILAAAGEASHGLIDSDVCAWIPIFSLKTATRWVLKGSTYISLASE